MNDIICHFKSESDADKFFVFLNQLHPKMKFTIEKQTENQLSFLDLLFTSNENNFLTSVYRKKHSIGLYTNYLSFTPFSYKIGPVKTLLVTYCLTRFHLFHYCDCFHSHVALILFKMTSSIC